MEIEPVIDSILLYYLVPKCHYKLRPNTALQTDSLGWAILRDGDSYTPFPVYHVHLLQGCG